jgi:hypothetical protein
LPVGNCHHVGVLAVLWLVFAVLLVIPLDFY